MLDPEFISDSDPVNFIYIKILTIIKQTNIKKTEKWKKKKQKMYCKVTLYYEWKFFQLPIWPLAEEQKQK